MKTVKHFVEKDNNTAFDLVLFNKLNSGFIGTGCNIETAWAWVKQKIKWIEECENEKYIGWVVTLNNEDVFKLYITKNIYNLKAKDWNHGKNLFNKYLKIKK